MKKNHCKKFKQDKASTLSYHNPILTQIFNEPIFIFEVNALKACNKFSPNLEQNSPKRVYSYSGGSKGRLLNKIDFLCMISV